MYNAKDIKPIFQTCRIMDTKKLLIAASQSIPAESIHSHLPSFPETWSEHNILVLKGNPWLRDEILGRWPAASVVAAKTRSEFRDLLKTVSHFVLLWDGEDLTRLLFEARLHGVPSKVIPVEVTRVVNKKLTENYDVYIGRGSPWGNPFAIGRGEGPDRAEVIRRYQDYFDEKLESDSSFKRGVLGLKGLKLACFCKPEACHGDVIAAYLNSLPSSEPEQENKS